MTTIHADELRPGDVVVYNGHNHQITASTAGTAGPGRSLATALAGPWPWITS